MRLRKASERDRTVFDREAELVDALRQLFIDDMQILGSVVDVVHVCLAIGNATQTDQRNPEALTGA